MNNKFTLCYKSFSNLITKFLMHSNSIKQKSIKQKLKKLSEEADAKELRAQNFNKDETAQNHGNFLCALDR